MFEHYSVVYKWIGRGFTQEIEWLQIQGELAEEWRGKYWTDFLNYMAQDKWELIPTVPLGGGQGPVYGVVAYFKRCAKNS